MKCLERREVPKSAGPRLVGMDGGIIGKSEGDPLPTDEYFWVRYAGKEHDVLKKFALVDDDD